MRQLSGVDATFLQMENARVTGHVAGLIIVDPSTAKQPINSDTIREFIRERIHLLEPLRWRLVNVPLGIDRPYWVQDGELDLDFHVRGIGLPSPGNDEQLAKMVAGLTARALDRSHPLWELYVIEGLEGGRVAIMTKLHHSAVDGASGMQITATLLSTDPDATVDPPTSTPRTERVPSELEMLTRGWLGVMASPARGVRLSMQLAREGRDVLRRLQLDGLDSLKPVLRAPSRAPRTSFNRPVTARRNWVFGTIPLSRVKRIKDAAGCTVNDVVMALCTSGLRRWLIEHGELPEAPLQAMVPVSIRAADQANAMGNQVSAVQAALPTQVEDPIERLRIVSTDMLAAKEQLAALPADLLVDFSQFSAPAAAEFAAKAAASVRWADRIMPPYNLVISNVPGPRVPLYYAGALVLANYPVSIITDGVGLNITLQSYRDSIDFGIISSPDLIPDLWELMRYIRDAVDELDPV